MFDLTLLTLPVLATMAVFGAAVFIGEEIVIDQVEVSHQLEWTGWTTTVATRQLTDEIRELNEAAASELTGVGVDETPMEKGLNAFEDYLQISSLVDGARDTLGLIPFYIEGEITESRGQAIMVARVVSADDNVPVHVISVVGDPNDIPAILREAALGILQDVNPYLVMLYYRQKESAAKEYDFPKTNAEVQRYLTTSPVEEHYLAYGLLGRAHMIKAERDPKLTPEERQAEYDRSIELLNAALVQKPDFLYPLVNLALIHVLRGENALAEQYFAKAVEANPNYLLTRRSWGDMLLKQGRLREATIQYVAAVEIAPENAAMRAQLAQLYADLGMRDAAREQWEAALRISPLTQAYADSLRKLDGAQQCAPGLGNVC